MNSSSDATARSCSPSSAKNWCGAATDRASVAATEASLSASRSAASKPQVTQRGVTPASLMPTSSERLS